MAHDAEFAARIRALVAREPETPGSPTEMRGCSMDGWLRVDAGDVGRGVAFARSLPPKG